MFFFRSVTYKTLTVTLKFPRKPFSLPQGSETLNNPLEACPAK